MPERHLRWGAEALRQQLQPLLPGLSVEVVASADSTNTRLLERARQYAGLRDAPVTTPGELEAGVAVPGARTPYGRRSADTLPCLLVAEQQTSGRGRAGRVWHSGAGAALTFSLSLPLSPPAWTGLSLAVGVALADALDPPADAAGPPRLWLKWPNDLWLLDAPGRGRKLGGVLIETMVVGERRMCVVGIGLNVMPQPLPDSAVQTACLRELDAGVGAPQVLHALALPLARALREFERDGFAPFAGAFRRRDLLAGQPVTTTQPGLPEGVAEGVDERGALRVRAGEVHALLSGEVSVRARSVSSSGA